MNNPDWSDDRNQARRALDEASSELMRAEDEFDLEEPEEEPWSGLKGCLARAKEKIEFIEQLLEDKKIEKLWY